MARCHHRACGRDFSGLTAFDRHLRLLKVPPWVECVDPESAGLIDKAGIWTLEGREGSWGYRHTGDGGNRVSTRPGKRPVAS